MKLGIIGLGSRMTSMVKQFMAADPLCELRAVMDLRCDTVKERLAGEGIAHEGTRFCEQLEELLEIRDFDALCIGTNCSSHAGLAAAVLPLGVPIFLEKPVATRQNDWKLLFEAGERSPQTPVLVSFPLRASPIVTLAKEIIDSGKLGTIEHVQAVNNVPYGGVYFHNWYRNEAETGGLFLQKATHDFDYINYLVGRSPVEITAMASKQIYKGERPAGLTCTSCGERAICPESPENLAIAGEPLRGDGCCFAADTGNHDAASVLIRYHGGMHAVYSQNFFARKKAARRGATLIGYKGTLEFDLYSGEIRVYLHHTPRVETYSVDTKGKPHMGGDEVLARNFAGMVRGRSESIAPLQAGLLSTLMCLKAQVSAETNSFQAITEQGGKA